ncbi:hypothetical protein D9M72_508730 [compost metagenome]
MHEVRERAAHRLHVGDALLQFTEVLLGDALDARAGAAAVVPQADQFGDFFHREPQVARALDEAQRVDVGVVVLAVAALGARHRGQQAQAFVVAHHARRHARQPRGLADGHLAAVGRGRRHH